MSQAQLFVDGRDLDFMGEVVDDFLSYTNNLQASRSGNLYTESEAKVKMVKVDEVKLRLGAATVFRNFLDECSSKRMTITVFFAPDCEDGESREVTYLGCLLSGAPEHAMFGDKITGFEFGYERRIERVL